MRRIINLMGQEQARKFQSIYCRAARRLRLLIISFFHVALAYRRRRAGNGIEVHTCRDWRAFDQRGDSPKHRGPAIRMYIEMIITMPGKATVK